jgi:hypothetical protein
MGVIFVRLADGLEFAGRSSPDISQYSNGTARKIYRRFLKAHIALNFRSRRSFPLISLVPGNLQSGASPRASSCDGGIRRITQQKMLSIPQGRTRHVPKALFLSGLYLDVVS